MDEITWQEHYEIYESVSKLIKEVYPDNTDEGVHNELLDKVCNKNSLPFLIIAEIELRKLKALEKIADKIYF